MERDSYPAPLCNSNHISSFICTNKQCQFFSFVCPFEDCEDCTRHKNCDKKLLDPILNNFKSKGYANRNVQSIIDTLILSYQDMAKKLMQYAQHLKSLREDVGLSKEQAQLIDLLRNRNINHLPGKILKSRFQGIVFPSYNIPPDIKDVIQNQLWSNFEELTKLKMFDYKQLSPGMVLETFRVASNEDKLKEQIELKTLLIKEAKIMTFWTFQLDNLKHIDENTVIQDIEYLKLMSLDGWSFRKLQLIGQYLPNLKQLRAVNCKLDDSDAVIIASSNNLQTLQTLNLHANNITGYGAIRIASAFENASTNLFLGDNPISADAKERIMELKPKTQWVLPWTFNLGY